MPSFLLYILKLILKIIALALIPAVLIIKLSFDSILPVVIYLQFLLIWCQAEIALKQHNLFAVQFEPSFTIIQTRTSIPSQDPILSVRIKNTSSNPAYSVTVTRVMENHNPVMPIEWKRKITRSPWINIGPNEVNDLCHITDIDYFRNKQIEVFYRNRFGDFRELFLIFSNDILIVIPPTIKEKGFLLNTFREIIELPELLKFKWRLH